jgi:long-chain acyl-CoA synthetase
MTYGAKNIETYEEEVKLKIQRLEKLLDYFFNFSYLHPVNSCASLPHSDSPEFPSMGVVVPFATIPEMFIKVTERFGASARPYLMYKVQGSYKGLGFTEIRQRVEQFAFGLAALGIERGDRVGIISENRPEWVIADMGTLFLGAFDVPVYPTLTPKQIEYIFDDAGVKLAIVSNQSQLSKVLKILPRLKNVRHIVIMGDQSPGGDGKVLNFPQVYDLGREHAARHEDHLRRSLERVRPDDLCTLIYTSGTTGNPKGVMLTHRNFASNIIASAQVIPFNHEDVLLSYLPLCHSFERMAGYYTATACGATLAYAESIDTVRDNLVEVRPTVMTSVPRLFERLYNRILKSFDAAPSYERKVFYWALEIGRRYAIAGRLGETPAFLRLRHRLAEKLVYQKLKARVGGRVRFFVSGGAALAREFGEFFEALGIKIVEGYGLTETSPVISVNPIDSYKFGTVGKPIPGVEVRIAPDGEILTRGPHIMKGYWNDRMATREAINQDGWFHTGDIGMFDSDGYLVITDRKKHLFVSSGGKNIAPQPIESLFLKSKYIDQFVLIGDRRMFLSALVVPDFDALKRLASARGISYNGEADLVKKEEIVKFVEKDIQELQRDLANYERVRKFTLLEKPLTLENGEITPTQKVRRKIVEERYADVIERMYSGLK